MNTPPVAVPISQQKARLRQIMRQRRREPTPAHQRKAAAAMARHLSQNHAFQLARDIALYLDNDGEIGTGKLIALCWRAGKRTWLPLITAGGELRFHRYRPGDDLVRGHFGIAHPRLNSPSIAAMELDLVLLPLVAFDRCGMRLGMGGGFYDRAFQSVRYRQRKPLLVGLAHGFQEVDRVPGEAWDKRLHAIATESGISRSAF